MALDQDLKASIIAKYKRKDGDTGSAEVKVINADCDETSFVYASKSGVEYLYNGKVTFFKDPR